MLRGDPTKTVPKLVEDSGAALLITDFGPLRLGRQWRKEVRGARPARWLRFSTRCGWASSGRKCKKLALNEAVAWHQAPLRSLAASLPVFDDVWQDEA